VLALAIAGVVQLVLQDRTKALGLVLIALCGVPFALRYTIETDYDRYLLCAYWALALLAGYGAQALVSAIGPRVGVRAATVGAAFVLLGSVGYTAERNRDVFAQRADYSGVAFVNRVTRETADDSIVVASWVYAAPLAYAAYVERRLGQRTVVSAEADELPSFLAMWAAERPVFVIYFKPLGESVSAIDGMRLLPIDREQPRIYRVRVPARRSHPIPSRG
jgi:hypothetical protein